MRKPQALTIQREKERAAELRALRYRMRETVQSVTTARGVAICGRRACFSPAGFPSVALKVEPSTGRAYFSGCTRCNSVWECPVCAPRIMSGRAADLGKLNEAHEAAGGSLYLLTLTIPHDEGDRLKPLRRQVSRAWQIVTRASRWKGYRRALGIVGTVRALEVTHGKNGWHPHLHIAAYAAKWTGEQLAEFRGWLLGAWTDAITRRTPEGKVYRAPSAQHGVTVQPLRGSEYLAKMGLGNELSGASTKEGREGHRTSWQILRDFSVMAFARTPDKGIMRRDRALWREFTDGIRGARQLTFSVGLRKKYGLGESLPDAEIPDTQGELEPLVSGEGETAYFWSAPEWVRVCRLGVAFRLALLQVCTLPRDEWTEAIWRLEHKAKRFPDFPSLKGTQKIVITVPLKGEPAPVIRHR